MGDFLDLHPRSALDTALKAGDIEWLLPAGWPAEIPEEVPLPYPNEAVDITLIAVRAIVDLEERARAILDLCIEDRCERSRELILSVAEDGGWPGAIAQMNLRPTPEEAAVRARMQQYRQWLRSEGRRIRRHLRKHEPEQLRDMQMRAFPQLFRTRAGEGPSLFDVLDEPNAALSGEPTDQHHGDGDEEA